MSSELLTIISFVVVGWVALWPARTRLGAVAYHLAALPTGLMAAPLGLVVSSVSKRPLDALSAAGGAILLIAFLWVVQRLVLDGRAAGTRVGPRSFLVAAGAVLGFGALFGFLRFSATNYDSISSYWPLGVELSRKGAYNVLIASARSPLIPSMNAIHVLFGSDWAYVIYPMLGVTVALWLAWALWSGHLSGPSFEPKTKRLVAGGVVAFLVLEPSYVFNTFMVHSQMISALYMLVALSGIWMAVRPDREYVDDAFLVVAGVAAAGLALARPDGLAYQFVPVAVAISALTISKVRWQSVAAFFAPAVLLVAGAYSAAFLRLGLWKAPKLGGTTTLAILVILALSASGPWLVQSIERIVPFRVSGERFLGVFVPVAAVLMVAVLVLKWSSARIALANAGINLFLGEGGYFYLWYAVVILLVLAALVGDATRTKAWTRSAFFGILLFFVIAGLVHGTSHEGRIGAGDSFNRVAFEILPIVLWLAGAMVARILAPAEHLA